jgi:hypothetical protein
MHIRPKLAAVFIPGKLGKGEYGYLAPTDTGNMGNAGGSGKMYTFSIME